MNLFALLVGGVGIDGNRSNWEYKVPVGGGRCMTLQICPRCGYDPNLRNSARAEQLIEALGHELSLKAVLVLSRVGEANVYRISREAHASPSGVKYALKRLLHAGFVKVSDPRLRRSRETHGSSRNIWSLNHVNPQTQHLLALLEEAEQ